MSRKVQVIPSDIGPMLLKLRTQAKLSQSAVATKITIDQSRVSRMESSELLPSATEVRTFLEAIGTTEALSYLGYLQKHWRVLQCPPITNPDLEPIWRADQKLHRLMSFEEDRNPPAAVRGEIQMHRDSLRHAADFLSRIDHDIAFIGQPGVGKTTALCLVSDLVLSDPKLPLDRRLLLETGKGRITLCEVHIKTGPAWGLVIEPLPEAEIYRLIGEVCASVQLKGVAALDREQTGLPREIDRALRNMAGLPRSVKKVDGKPVVQDPLTTLRESFEELRSEFASRVKLWKRTTQELWFPEGGLEPRQWLRDTFAKVNKGQLVDVSLPARIGVLVPKDLLDQTTFNLTLTDTRGVDETAVRPDLRSRIDNPRTLTVLCSEFKAAPDAKCQQLLQHLTETGGERAVIERTALIVLPQPGDAGGVTDDTGQPVDSDVDGYEIKRDHITSGLKTLVASEIPILMFNAASDDPGPVAADIVSLIRRMRERQVDRIDTVGKAIDHLIKHYEQHAAKLVRDDVSKTLRLFLKKHEILVERLEPAHGYLLAQLSNVHARTVWATTRRQGGWYGLDVYYCLGAGAAAEAKRRCRRFFQDLEVVVGPMRDNDGLAAAHPFLDEVIVNAQSWKDAFFESAQRAGAETFRPALQDETRLWADCEGRWGQGGGYREDIGRFFRDWFTDPEHEGLHRALEKRIKAAWQVEVVGRLRALCEQPSVRQTA